MDLSEMGYVRGGRCQKISRGICEGVFKEQSRWCTGQPLPQPRAPVSLGVLLFSALFSIPVTAPKHCFKMLRSQNPHLHDDST